VARVLIVGCGCRGRELGAALRANGHAVRATTRDPGALAAIETAGLEAVVADPDRLGTLLPQLAGVTVLCWLLGAARGDGEVVAALHGSRLESLTNRLIDSGVRGLVYEAAGTVERTCLEQGARLARDLGDRHRMPVEVVDQDPRHSGAWLVAMRMAVARVLA
jgi:uncharacterized protein YbjT (DUF2867 family)